MIFGIGGKHWTSMTNLVHYSIIHTTKIPAKSKKACDTDGKFQNLYVIQFFKQHRGAASEQLHNMKKIIHVNQHVIKQNKDGQNRPVITCKTYKSNDYAHEVVIYGQDGKEAARVIYRPENPLSCGAKVWIETINKTHTIIHTP